jgi:hypothetical protein
MTHYVSGPDRGESSCRLVAESEALIERLELDAEARREFEQAREAHAGRLAQLRDGNDAAFVEACLHHLTRLGEIAMRNRGRGRGRGGG